MSTGFVTLFEKGNLELHNDAEHEALWQLADKNGQFQRNISEDVPVRKLKFNKQIVYMWF